MLTTASGKLTGEYGCTYISDTALHSGEWCKIHANVDSVIATLVATNWDGNATTSVSLSAGSEIWGTFTDITLTSGAVTATKG